jgi:outer membrane lipoprotein-sorting protein
MRILPFLLEFIPLSHKNNQLFMPYPILTIILLAFFCTLSVGCAQTTEEIITKTVEATGGREKQKSLKSMITIAKFYVLNSPFKDMPPSTVKTIMERPNKIFIVNTQRNSTTIQSFDGKAGWATMGAQAIPLPPETALALARSADLDGYFGAFIDFQNKGYKVENLGVSDVEGVSCYRLKFTYQKNMQEFFINTDSFLPYKRVSISKTLGMEVISEEYYRKYMTIEGVKFPKEIEVKGKSAGDSNYALPAMGAKIVYESIELNPKITPDTFTKPK